MCQAVFGNVTKYRYNAPKSTKAQNDSKYFANNKDAFTPPNVHNKTTTVVVSTVVDSKNIAIINKVVNNLVLRIALFMNSFHRRH